MEIQLFINDIVRTYIGIYFIVSLSIMKTLSCQKKVTSFTIFDSYGSVNVCRAS